MHHWEVNTRKACQTRFVSKHSSQVMMHCTECAWSANAMSGLVPLMPGGVTRRLLAMHTEHTQCKSVVLHAQGHELHNTRLDSTRKIMSRGLQDQSACPAAERKLAMAWSKYRQRGGSSCDRKPWTKTAAPTWCPQHQWPQAAIHDNTCKASTT